MGKVMTRRQKRERREKLAADVVSGMTFEEVGAKYNVSASLVRAACREHSVDARTTTPAARSFVILRRLLAGETQVEIAEDLNLTRTRVNQIAKNAREAGFQV